MTITVSGNNLAPIAVADTAWVKEDVTATASGNVLANDSDANFGVVLSVSNSGTKTGQYGVLALSSDGSYAYLKQQRSKRTKLARWAASH